MENAIDFFKGDTTMVKRLGFVAIVFMAIFGSGEDAFSSSFVPYQPQRMQSTRESQQSQKVALTCTASPSVTTDHSDGSIENSIQWCIDNLPYGGTVNLESGTYYTRGSIVLTSNIIFHGQGADYTTIQYNGGGSDDVISNAGNVILNVKIDDVTIRGSGYGTDYNQACILITDANGGENQRITIRDSSIEQCGQYGIHIKGADGVHITYNSLSYNGTDPAHDHNIYLRRVKNAKVELSDSNYSAGNGLNVACSENVVARNLTAKYNGQNGIRFASSGYVKAYSNTTSYNGYNDEDPCSGLGDELCNGIELRTEGEDCNDYTDVNRACVKSSISNNNYSYWLYIRSATNYELDNNSKSGNGAGDEAYVSSSSTSAEGVCESIPTDSTAWPFDLSDNDGDGYTESQGDCNDNNSNINPGMNETPYNGIDDDCNVSTLDDDLDQDGYGYASDCNDNNNTIYPGAPETCGDGIDQDCDGFDTPCDSGNACIIPASGDWTVTQSCTITTSVSAPANVIVKNGVVLTISATGSLNIDLANYSLKIEDGGGVLIREGGKVD